MKHSLYRLGRLVPVVALAGVMYGGPVVAQTTDQAQAWPPGTSEQAPPFEQGFGVQASGVV